MLGASSHRCGGKKGQMSLSRRESVDVEVPLGKREVKPLIKVVRTGVWQRQWDDCQKGRWFY